MTKIQSNQPLTRSQGQSYEKSRVVDGVDAHAVDVWLYRSSLLVVATQVVGDWIREFGEVLSHGVLVKSCRTSESGVSELTGIKFWLRGSAHDPSVQSSEKVDHVHDKTSIELTKRLLRRL
jgi:hypothetical protein